MAGALSLVWWGVGKWLGARGAVVARILADPEWRDVLLGDNGNRLEIGPDPAEFAAARSLGRAVLPGSDPLPLRGEEARVGAYGFAVEAALDPLRPAAAFLALLKSASAFVVFGRRQRLVRFVGNQVALKLKLRRLFQRARLDQNEINILLGALTALDPSKRGADEESA